MFLSITTSVFLRGALTMQKDFNLTKWKRERGVFKMIWKQIFQCEAFMKCLLYTNSWIKRTERINHNVVIYDREIFEYIFYLVKNVCMKHWKIFLWKCFYTTWNEGHKPNRCDNTFVCFTLPLCKMITELSDYKMWFFHSLARLCNLKILYILNWLY